MELMVSPTSPFARKVQILAREQGLSEAINLRALHPLDDAAELARMNPLGRVPALITDDDKLVVDSPIICAWLDNLAVTQGRDSMLGDNASHRLVIQQGQALADGIMESAFLMVMERGRPERQHSDFWQDRRRDAITRTLDYLEAQGDAVMPAGIHLASIALACALGYLDFRHDAMQWRSGRPGLAAWFKAWEGRDSFMATQPLA
ncbi:glutathione S-transferase N-terminal domain-containing protein [Alcanivorax sp.]|uniref:glutathione S-transferase N-terminal domain-containing protein n=1 Tax=Alcanivorax sp. TaxID=1872427 RepID=UPI0025C0CE90|nr:glutathione S-transferase N-terminal domain-containing protein [Alcanivorax sp.]